MRVRQGQLLANASAALVANLTADKWLVDLSQQTHGTQLLNITASSGRRSLVEVLEMDWTAGASLIQEWPHHSHHQASPVRHAFWTMEWDQAKGMEVFWCGVALFLSGVLCAAAGIGGGGIYVVALMLAGLLSPYDAVPLSKAVVFFGSLSTLALNLMRMWNPSTDVKEKVIDFTTVRVVAPAALGGTFLGVLLNWHTAGVGIVLTLAAILIFMTITVSRTAIKQYLQEEQEAAKFVGLSSTGRDSIVPIETRSTGGEQAKQLEESGKKFTTSDLVLSVGCELVVIVAGALRFHMATCKDELAGHGAPDSCSHPLAGLVFLGNFASIMANPSHASMLAGITTGLPLVLCLLLCICWGWRATQGKGSSWSAGDVATYQAMGVFTGCFAGLVGVGGGLVFSPFFLVMGLDPAAAVATSSTCVLYTSSSTTFQYILSDRVIMSLALVYGLVTTIASYLGTSLVMYLQDTFKGRRSYVTMIVVVAVGLSAVLSLVKVYTILSNPAPAS